MWKVIAGWLVKGAIWAAEHPDEVTKMVDAVKQAKTKQA